MPWYYAGADAKPVGPISLEELQSRRLGGLVHPDTYIIEHTGLAVENMAWKRYQEVFPVAPIAPPAVPTAPPPPVATTVAPAPVAQAHPLFPSAAPIATHPSVFPPDTRPDPYYARPKPTNAWCAWGFGLGLGGFVCSFLCGIGLFLALPGFFLSIMGLAQVGKNPAQGGRSLAIWGLILSAIALIISAIFVYEIAGPILKAHGLTVTEQTSNDSE